MEKFLARLIQRFCTLETLEGFTLLFSGIGLMVGQLFGLLPFVWMYLIAVGAYKIYINRND